MRSIYIRSINISVLVACLLGGIYYTVVDNEAQGAVVVLLGILYFLGFPQVIPKE
jgi:hypothetical protein